MFKTISPLIAVIAFRFFGLFVVLPMLSLYALNMQHETTFLVGVVIGSYALTQSFLQIPFGIMSDKIGRKTVLVIGLIIFGIGSVICAISTDIYILIFGRLLQGAGAIGSVVVAAIADVVKEEQRAHAMALTGGTIAMSFAAAMIIGPVLGAYWGVGKLFWSVALLTVAVIAILLIKVKDFPKIVHTYTEKDMKLINVFKDKNLVQMYVTFLFHESVMTAAFLMIPIVMTKTFAWQDTKLWIVYAIATFFGILAMAPAVILGEKYNKGKQVFIVSIIIIAAGFILMGYSNKVWLFITGVVLFFIGFSMFEPLLQSFVAKFAKVYQRGAALGASNTFAYTGSFLGGITSGYLMHIEGRASVAVFVIIIAAFWILWVLRMNNPGFRSSIYLPIERYDRAKLPLLGNAKGIIEYYINETEKVIIVKYEQAFVNEKSIKHILLR